MSPREVASLSEALLAAKGAAAPSAPSVRAAPARARPRSAGPAGRARVSVRLDAGRHLRLRLAAAHLGKTLDGVLRDAIEQYLQTAPGGIAPACGCLRAPAPDGVVMPFRAP